MTTPTTSKRRAGSRGTTTWVNEYRLLMHPVVMGDGKRPFAASYGAMPMVGP